MASKVKRSSSFSEGDRRKGRRTRGGAVTGKPGVDAPSHRSRRRSRKMRSQTDVSHRRCSNPDDENEITGRQRRGSIEGDETPKLKVTFTASSARRYSDSESDRYDSCGDDDETESDLGASSSEDEEEDNDWSAWITLAKRTNHALLVTAPPQSAAAPASGMESKKDDKRLKKAGFFRRLFGGDKKEKKGGTVGAVSASESPTGGVGNANRRPQRFPSPPKRKAPEIDPESRRKAIEVHVAGTRHEVVITKEEPEVIKTPDKSRTPPPSIDESRDDLDEILDSMSTSTAISKASSRMTSKSHSPSPSLERCSRPVIVRVNSRKKSSTDTSPLANAAPRIPGPDPALVTTSFKYVPGGSCPMTSTHVSDRSHVGRKLDFTISTAARNAGISPALLKKLCADSRDIDMKTKEDSATPPPSLPLRADSSGTGSVETVIANSKYLKRTRSDLTSLDGFSDIPIYECHHETLPEEVECRRYGQRDTGSERDEDCVGDGDERRRSLMMRQHNLKSLVVDKKLKTKIVIEDFDNDEGKAAQTSTWIKTQATLAQRRSPPPSPALLTPYDDGKTIVSSADSGYSSGDVTSRRNSSEKTSCNVRTCSILI